jgi:hypothetical protein
MRAGRIFRGVLFALLLPLPVGAAEWEPVSDDSGITVSWRRVDGARVREIRAVGVVAQPVGRLLGVLRDVVHYPEFMPPTEAVELLAEAADSARIHVTINPPWVSRRDYCVDVRWTRFPDGSVGSAWTQTDAGCPTPRRGVVRHLRTEGTWRLRDLDGRRTFIEYQAITDPGGSLPAWAINRATVKAMRTMFQALGTRAADPAYAQAPVTR